MLTTPATNFTHATRHGTVPKSFQNASFNCGIPLPAAAGQKAVSNTPTASDETSIIARLPRANVSFD